MIQIINIKRHFDIKKDKKIQFTYVVTFRYTGSNNLFNAYVREDSLGIFEIKPSEAEPVIHLNANEIIAAILILPEYDVYMTELMNFVQSQKLKYLFNKPLYWIENEEDGSIHEINLSSL